MAPAVFLLNVCKAKNIIEFSPYYFHIYGYDFHKYDILIVGNPQFHRFLIVMKLLQLYIRHSFTLYAYLSYLFICFYLTFVSFFRYFAINTLCFSLVLCYSKHIIASKNITHFISHL